MKSRYGEAWEKPAAEPRPGEHEPKPNDHRTRRCEFCYGKQAADGSYLRRVLVVDRKHHARRSWMACPCLFVQAPPSPLDRTGKGKGKHGSRARTRKGRLSRPHPETVARHKKIMKIMAQLTTAHAAAREAELAATPLSSA